ncbi:RCC1 domain-containing protein [Sandaracinus amylolyticus]|uniref:BNR repeat domain protein n=1 Tax=Sandaracinus amylolyticus TaxID=927083 RepID=A0A0F6W991_9BACT|nr:hypothetical protein [Sandaracinus amylolyticus]AKF10590.1 BNR repeat domain protein [Sandaracinus amylolyticus]
MTRTRVTCLVVIAIALASCEGTSFRCDPTPSWSYERPDGGGEPRSPREPTECTFDDCFLREVAAGARHTCVLASSGAVFCWGSNDRGQAAPDASEHEITPRRVLGLASVRDGLALGAAHTCVEGATEILCWGEPRVVGGARGEIVTRPEAGFMISAGALHTCLQRFSGGGIEASDCFGAWDGRDPATGPALDPARRFDGIEMFAGGMRSCGLARDALTLECWGSAPPGGRLQPGAWTERAITIDVAPIPLGPALGQEHACVRGGTTVRCWGRGDFGQLGDGTMRDHDAPVPVIGLPERPIGSLCVGGGGPLEIDADGVLVVPAASGFSCASVLDGVWCWGANERGQLGDGTHQDRTTPVRVLDIHDEGSVTCGEAHACFRTFTRLVCWGDNRFGQLGAPSGELDHATRPVLVSLFPDPLERDE